MTIIERIRQIKANIIKNREAELMRIAFDQIALLKLRIQTTGLNSNESPFAPYTPDYAKTRQKKGYQIGYVDFTVTGQFMAGIKPVIVESSTFRTIIEFRPTGDRGENIVKGARKKRGNILEPSQSELKIARDANRQRILNLFNF